MRKIEEINFYILFENFITFKLKNIYNSHYKIYMAE